MLRSVAEQETFESRRLRREGTHGLKFNNIEAATEAKCGLETKQRTEAKERKEAEARLEAEDYELRA